MKPPAACLWPGIARPEATCSWCPHMAMARSHPLMLQRPDWVWQWQCQRSKPGVDSVRLHVVAAPSHKQPACVFAPSACPADGEAWLGPDMGLDPVLLQKTDLQARLWTVWQTGWQTETTSGKGGLLPSFPFGCDVCLSPVIVVLPSAPRPSDSDWLSIHISGTCLEERMNHQLVSTSGLPWHQPPLVGANHWRLCTRGVPTTAA